MVMYNEFLKPYMAGHPNSRILYHEFGPFDEWSYVVVRWLGGKRVQAMRDEGKLVFLTDDNRASMDRLLRKDISTSLYRLILTSWKPCSQIQWLWKPRFPPHGTRFTTLRNDGF